MAEFSLIDRFCKGIGVRHAHTRLGVGDDAAVIAVPPDMELAISVDTMVAGVHFYPDVEPAKLAYKLLAVNLSDMAAMAAVPKWATLALTLPTIDKNWLAAFSESLNYHARHFDVQLIGGDTTSGPLSLSMQIMGLLPAGKGLRRSGVQPGDEIWVTGILGDAALALAEMKNPGVAGLNSADDLQAVKQKLEMPVPQLGIGQALREHATACIDISDGLLADLGHLAVASGVAIDVQLEDLPISAQYRQYLHSGGDWGLALSGGDDYQLAFSIPVKHGTLLAELSAQNEVEITRIGTAQASESASVSAFYEGDVYSLQSQSGYQHFS